MLYQNVHIVLGEMASAGSDALYVMHKDVCRKPAKNIYLNHDKNTIADVESS